MAQVQGRPVGLLLTLRGSVHPFITRPSYVAIADLPFDERLAIMKKPSSGRGYCLKNPARGILIA
jgi:hypothetical protein